MPKRAKSSLRNNRKYVAVQTNNNAATIGIAIAALVAFFGAMFFLSVNFTGNAVANFTNSTLNMTDSSSTYIGVLFFILGILLAFLSSRNRKF